MKLLIILISLYSIFFSVTLCAQDKIAVMIDGNASENAKNLAEETINSTINQSQYFRVATWKEDITLAITVNRKDGNFEFWFMVTHKSKNFEKSYYASTKSGYDGFEDVIKNEVNQILADFPRTSQITKPEQPQALPQPANNESLSAQRIITRNKYTPPTSIIETTLREGFELQGDITFLGGAMDPSIGGNFTVNYRFNSNFALGVGFGVYSGYEIWNPVFANAIWNFTESKFSPFVALEVGICPYTYDDYTYNYYYNYSDSYYSDSGIDFYFGLVGGVQYSFNKNFSLKANLKMAIGAEYVGFNIGIGFGAIYHF